MDFPKTPTSSLGTSDTETPQRTQRHVTQRAQENSPADTSQREPDDSTFRGIRPDVIVGLPPIVEHPDSGQDADYEEVYPGTPGLGLTPLTGMSLELQGTSVGAQESDPEEGVASGNKLHDLEADDALDSIWAVNEITNQSIIAALNERVYRHLNAALALDDEKNPDQKEYIRMAQTLAMLEARRYARKKLQRGTSDASITSSRSRTSAGPTTDRQKGKRPLRPPPVSRAVSPEAGPAPSSSEAVPLPVATTTITESTSQESGHHSTVIRPPPANWGDRVRLQRARNGALTAIGTTTIPDQDVIFQDSCPYDMRIRSPLGPEPGTLLADPAIKQESPRPSVPPVLIGARGVTTRTKRTRFIGNTSITPMSQQHYPGRLNLDSDPLLGPRHATEFGSESGQESERSVVPRGVGRPDREPPPHINTTRYPTREREERVSNRDSRETMHEDDEQRYRRVNRTLPPRREGTQTGWERERQLRGFSMPAVISPPTISMGKQEVDQHYRDSMLSRLMNTITEALGQPLRFPDGYKPPFKDDRSTKYSGSLKFADLEHWLAKLAYRYALQKFGGGSYDMDRIRVLSMTEYLDGDALNWFTTHVLSVKRSTLDWSFCDVIAGLYDRYILPTSMQDARENFRKVRYNTALGVQGFYDALLEHAQNMAIYPDSYTILEEFMSGLPHTMLTRCF
jgi:hypothetical protein